MGMTGSNNVFFKIYDNKNKYLKGKATNKIMEEKHIFYRFM
jgi:hypothetical protein